jgi:leucyl/phenylalanyl-tRNA--protein transferase
MSAIDPEELLLAYQLGIFPMAESRFAEEVLWIRPRERGILPLTRFHVPRRLARTVRNDRYRVRVNTAFGAVIRGCATAGPDRGDTWINQPIVDVFEALHLRGHAHSVETWDGEELVGGVYGLSLGAAFFAESKFSRRTDASKVALVHLAARLKFGGYRLLDAQFPNPHLTQFGAIAVSERRFGELLEEALVRSGDFYSLGRAASGAAGGVAGTVPGATVVGAGAVSSTGAGGAPVATGATAVEATVSGASVLQVITQTS